jgi:hypothetical protein
MSLAWQAKLRSPLRNWALCCNFPATEEGKSQEDVGEARIKQSGFGILIGARRKVRCSPSIAYDVEITNDRLLIADGASLTLFDWARQRRLKEWPFPGSVVQLAIHPDGRHVATVNGNGTWYVLRLEKDL